MYVFVIGIGTPPQVLPLASMPPTPEPKGGGGGEHSPAGEGFGGVPIPTTGESLALCLLCGKGAGVSYSLLPGRVPVYMPVWVCSGLSGCV